MLYIQYMNVTESLNEEIGLSTTTTYIYYISVHVNSIKNYGIYNVSIHKSTKASHAMQFRSMVDKEIIKTEDFLIICSSLVLCC